MESIPCCESQQQSAGVRVVVLNLPEDEGEGLGFRLTRTLWDPYPWVHEVKAGSRAEGAGLRAGDCLLQADGRDLLGLTVGEVAGVIRGDGGARGLTLLVWSCGLDPRDDPELLWSGGGGGRGERARRALAGVVRALACCVCAATAAAALACARSHLYCEGCWSRVERCALCREPLPAKDSPYAKNLVAEQVFEAIAHEYEIKLPTKTKTVSAYSSPNPSPNISPAPSRKGQYQLSMMNRNRLNATKYSSDPNIRRSLRADSKPNPPNFINSKPSDSCQPCNCQKERENAEARGRHDETTTSIPKINISDSGTCESKAYDNIPIQHKLVARLRQACSLADLQNFAVQSCQLSKSLNNIATEKSGASHQHSSSMDNIIKENQPDVPVYLLSPPPIYVLACDHH